MIIVKNKIAGLFLSSHYHAICIWPFLFIRPGSVITNHIGMINHERIHARQQLEMLWLFFFVWYVIEYLIHLIHHQNHNKAYRAISYEREAFDNDENLNYLKRRKTYAWMKYL